ncbi:hypothetical protein NDN08_002699 [Rhodosorus marinus]|uniref:Uncharacterized protein n=1 Tax=Rhodosorus marinus TaxID=101924 RepID=A0AAV8UVW7_9RHOD|nr:hypothetical protein NDN08_002699 [Rhodosorus marinus]
MGVFERENSFCFLDWDDTLMFTSVLEEYLDSGDNSMPDEALVEKLAILDKSVARLLIKIAGQSNVMIVSNAEMSWIDFSCSKFFPSVKRVLAAYDIDVLSARDTFSDEFKEHPEDWKAQMFCREVSRRSKAPGAKLNIVVVGDDVVDILAAERLGNLLPYATVKAVKFTKDPTVDQLLRQISLFNIQFPRVHSWPRSTVVSVPEACTAHGA